MRKTLTNVLLEGEGKRLIVKDGKQKYFNDTMKQFPVEQLIGKTADVVKVVNNLIIEIRLPNGEVFPARAEKTEHNTQAQSQNSTNMQIDHNRKPARAPYNFVPLNQQVVQSDEGIVLFDKFHQDKYNGFIDLEITALTDIFVRGILEKNFMVNGQFAIPGSSLRGLMRTLVEVVGYGEMEFVDKKKKMFFRNISDDHYKKVFLNFRKNGNQDIVSQKSKAGWISKRGNKYVLNEASGFFKVNRNKLKEFGIDFSKDVYHVQDIWYAPKSIRQFHPKRLNSGKTIDLEYNIVNSISLNQRDGFIKGKLLITGTFSNTKHFQWIIPEFNPNNREHDITDIVQEYLMDENRDEGADLVKELNKVNRTSIPCFYIPDTQGRPIALGHTGIFRYPYKHTIGNAIKQDKILGRDIAQSIFGYAPVEGNDKEIVAGRVFFEDAIATHIAGTEFGALKILSSPKPTSFQLYLEQLPDRHNHKIAKDAMHNWSHNDHKIRGYKMYWHKETDWRNPNVIVTADNQRDLILRALELKNEQFTVGEILKKDSNFKGRIRFENLTKKELGALLFVLDLPEGCAHKLGMGKSLGLGSVKISHKLVIIHRNSRYEHLFSDEQWHTGEESKEANEFKDSFAQYISSNTSQSLITNADDYWANDPRMKELRHMLTFEHKPKGVSWQDRTRYMTIPDKNKTTDNEYKDRPVLSKPSEVVRDETY